MNFKKLTLSLTTFFFTVLICYSQAGATLFLDDWDISYNNWAPGSNAPAYVVYKAGGGEDYLGGIHSWEGSGRVYPGYGGQCFDAEAIYFGIDYNANKAYIAVISGTPSFGAKTWWSAWYRPGDIAIDIGNDGMYDSAISASNLNILYQEVTEWQLPSSPYSASTPYKQVTSGSTAAITSAYTLMSQDNGGYEDRYGIKDGRDNGYKGYWTDIGWPTGGGWGPTGINAEHWAFEAIVDLDLLDIGYNESFKIHWTQQCGNDVIELTGVTPGVTPVPEPCTMLLLGTGLIGLAGFRRKLKK